jgi:hypothetical protein
MLTLFCFLNEPDHSIVYNHPLNSFMASFIFYSYYIKTGAILSHIYLVAGGK